MAKNSKDVAHILDLAISKSYDDFIKMIVPSKYYENLGDILERPFKPVNIINSLIFISKDLNLFTREISKKGYTINEGPQS